MRKFFFLHYFLTLFAICCLYTLSFSQEMKIIRVVENKIIGDKGSKHGITQEQTFAIYRLTATGRRPIGSARVFIVKSTICALDILYNEERYPVKVGDMLMAMEEKDEPVPPAAAVVSPPPPEKKSSNRGKFGIRGGIGTDISGGLVYGGNFNYLFPTVPSPFEVGVVVFGGSFEETTSEEINTYVEKTNILVIGVLGNYLVNYNRFASGVFFLVGSGFGFIDVAWEESSDTDESLGNPLPGGGSVQSDEGSAFGFIFNAGLGYKFSNSGDIRLEIPVFIITSAPSDASSVIPTFTLTIGFRFN
jgi:hypothetical protein